MTSGRLLRDLARDRRSPFVAPPTRSKVETLRYVISTIGDSEVEAPLLRAAQEALAAALDAEAQG